MKRHLSRQDANMLARALYAELTRDVEVRCDFEEIEAFVLEAKPAVLILDWKGVENPTLAALFDQLPFPSLSLTAKESETEHQFFMIINVKAVLARVDRQPMFALEVGWRHDQSADENLTHAFDRQSFIGFILGFPEQAIKDFQSRNGVRIYIPFTRFKMVRAINFLLNECRKIRDGSRAVHIRNPDGYPIYTWIAFGDRPDPEEILIAELVHHAYSCD